MVTSKNLHSSCWCSLNKIDEKGSHEFLIRRLLCLSHLPSYSARIHHIRAETIAHTARFRHGVIWPQIVSRQTREIDVYINDTGVLRRRRWRPNTTTMYDNSVIEAINDARFPVCGFLSSSSKSRCRRAVTARSGAIRQKRKREKSWNRIRIIWKNTLLVEYYILSFRYIKIKINK